MNRLQSAELEVINTGYENKLQSIEMDIKPDMVRMTCRDCCISGHSEHAHTGWERTYHCRCEARLYEMDIRGESITRGGLSVIQGQFGEHVVKS